MSELEQLQKDVADAEEAYCTAIKALRGYLKGVWDAV